MRQASRGATMTNNRAEGSSGGAPGTGIGEDGDPSPTIASSHIPAIAFAQNQRDELREMDVAGALAAEPGMKQQTYIAFSAKDHGGDATENVSPTLRAGGFTGSHANAGVMPAVAFQSSQSGVRLDDVHATLDSNNGSRRHNGIVTDWAVRRLTPVECERLQGFPDHYTNIPWRGKNGAPDGPRYKALGNSMAVNVMRWIGMRIQMVSEIADAQSLEAAE
jgi:DNA (cytosine-5)-methyltransferase 1